MSATPFALFLIAVWVFIGFSLRRSRMHSKDNRNNSRSSDGHIVPRNDDMTCETKYGHHHATIDGEHPRYIVHEEPNEGYVILNGVKRKITDCRNL